MRAELNPKTQKELLDWFRYAPAPLPRSQADLFPLLATYNPRTGWDAFIETIDFTDVTPSQICQVVLGRPPVTVEQAIPASGYDPRKHFRGALVSREFRQRFLATFLRAYPLLGRDVFIHVPKCAGTDLTLNLGWRSVPLPRTLEVEGWMNDVEFLRSRPGWRVPPPRDSGCSSMAIWNWANMSGFPAYAPTIAYLPCFATPST